MNLTRKKRQELSISASKCLKKEPSKLLSNSIKKMNIIFIWEIYILRFQ